MPRVRLTKSTIDALPVRQNETVYWDIGLPGFGVKVTPKGKKVFLVLYRIAGAGSRLRKYTIGPYGRVTLAMAKAQAQKIFAARLDGRDPAGEKRESRRKLALDCVDDLVERYIQERLPQLRSGKDIARRLRRGVVSRWLGKSIHDIKKRDVIDLVTEAAQPLPSAGQKLLKYLKTFFRWCVGRAIIENSPAEGLAPIWRWKNRDRVLTDRELAAIVKAAQKMGSPFGGIVELLALTGQRREEVAQLSWTELDAESRTWLIPGERSKNGKPHVVHLSDQAWAVLERSPKISEFVFSTSSGRYFQAFSRSKRDLDKLCGITGWWLHDLRRTAVSGMARLGVQPHVADKILNHQSGTISGVAAVYQRHDFMAERKKATELWGAHIGMLNRGPSEELLVHAAAHP
jgi:integrase